MPFRPRIGEDVKDFKDRINQYMRNKRIKYRERILRTERQYRVKALEILGNKCVRCGFSDLRALQVDHVNGGGTKEHKKYGTSRGIYMQVIRTENKDGKYQLLCANCNWIKREDNKEHANKMVYNTIR